MRTIKTVYHFEWLDTNLPRSFRTGLSLHSHTCHSKEYLSFISRYARRYAAIRRLLTGPLERYRRTYGCELDFARAWWTPPLDVREAYDLERGQIETRLQLASHISITDHDTIAAFDELPLRPVSVEWTVPYESSFFHLGVHNIPPDGAIAWMARFAAITNGTAGSPCLQDVLSEIDRTRNMLVVLNHPFWDEAQAGPERHAALLQKFLDRFGPWIHALEFNGLRPWAENRDVNALAGDKGYPVVSGGDRHGVTPNATINLTRSRTFDEFVAEVRDGRSAIAVLRQYSEPFTLRYFRAIREIVSDYPQAALGRRHWADRVFYSSPDGEMRMLSREWHAGAEPLVVVAFVQSMRALGGPWLLPFIAPALWARQRSLETLRPTRGIIWNPPRVREPLSPE